MLSIWEEPIIFQMIHQFVFDSPFHEFYNNTAQRNWAVVRRHCFVPFFEHMLRWRLLSIHEALCLNSLTSWTTLIVDMLVLQYNWDSTIVPYKYVTTIGGQGREKQIQHWVSTMQDLMKKSMLRLQYSCVLSFNPPTANIFSCIYWINQRLYKTNLLFDHFY